jgi:hypothetical protein
MLILQYAAIAASAAMTSGNPTLAVSLVVGAGCVGAAAVTGYVVRRIHAQDSAARVGALCIATLCFQVVSPHLINGALPAWLVWVTTSPLSAIAVVFGATHGSHRFTGAFV